MSRAQVLRDMVLEAGGPEALGELLALTLEEERLGYSIVKPWHEATYIATPWTLWATGVWARFDLLRRIPIVQVRRAEEDRDEEGFVSYINDFEGEGLPWRLLAQHNTREEAQAGMDRILTSLSSARRWRLL